VGHRRAEILHDVADELLRLALMLQAFIATVISEKARRPSGITAGYIFICGFLEGTPL